VEVQVNSRVVAAVSILDVAGELDLYTSPKLKAALDDMMTAGHTRLVVNLLQAKYLDSTALAILSAALQETKAAGGTLSLVFNQPHLTRLFAITGLADVFPIFPTETEALDAVSAWTAPPPGA
jgi:anti-sigma B factor antagonist